MSAETPQPPPIYSPKTAFNIASRPIPPWRIKGILPTQGLATIYGPSTAGKSFLAIDIAAAISLGNDWFGHRVRQAPVMYVALEGEGGFPKRLRAWEQYNECRLPDELLFIIGEPFEINNPLHVAQLAVVTRKGSVIVIDTLNRSSPGSDENASRDMSGILAGCKRLATLIEGLVLLVHHTGKDETRGMRGHSSLIAAVDASIEVCRDGDLRSWTVAKAKDDGDGAELCFKLAIENLGSDEDGDAITSCAIEPTTVTAAPKQPPSHKRSLKGNQKLVLDAITTALQTDLLTFDGALELAVRTLDHVESRHRLQRARQALWSLIKSKDLIYDEETYLVSLPAS